MFCAVVGRGKSYAMATLVFETIIHRADGETETYYEHGNTPQSLEVLQEKFERYPNGRQELFQHGDGYLRDVPPDRL